MESSDKTRRLEAAECKRSGRCNCAQAVLCTYADIAGIDTATALNVGNAFAAGMGNMEGTCGALVGAGMVLGLVCRDKAQSMRGMKQMMQKFQERNGSTTCRVLKGVDTKKVLRQCPDCVSDACEFLEEVLELQK